MATPATDACPHRAHAVRGYSPANALWTWLFFAWRRGGLAFAEGLLLVVLNTATALAFWRIRPVAGMLLVPYLGWVGFASALTWATWQRNPALLE